MQHTLSQVFPSGSLDNTTVVIQNLPDSANRAKLKNVFSQFGTVTKCFVQRNYTENGEVVECYMKYQSVDSADQAIDACSQQHIMVDGRPVSAKKGSTGTAFGPDDLAKQQARDAMRNGGGGPAPGRFERGGRYDRTPSLSPRRRRNSRSRDRRRDRDRRDRSRGRRRDRSRSRSRDRRR